MKHYSIILLLTAAMISGCSSARFYHDAPPLPFAEIDYTFDMQTGEINGVPLAWYDSGGYGEVVLLVHGLASNAGFWRSNAQDLRAAGLRVIAVDLPGYGKSGKSYDLPYSMKFFANTLEGLLEHLDIGSVTIVGHSMGAQIAMTLVLQECPRVKGLVLLSPAGIERFKQGEGEWLKESVTPEFVINTPEEHIRANLASNFFCWRDEFEWMVEERARVAKTPEFKGFAYAVSRSVAAMIDEPVWMDLERIIVPVMIIGGEKDNLIPNPYLHGGYTEPIMQRGADEMPNAELHMLSDTGHMLQIERAEHVNHLIINYLTRK